MSLVCVLAVSADPCHAQGGPSFHLSVSGNSRAAGEPGEPVEFSAVVELTTEGLTPGEPGAQGWNLSLSAEGCSIVDGTTDGTAAAQVEQDNGFAFTELTVGEGNEGVVSLVILSFDMPVTLDPGESPHPLLFVTLRGIVPEQEFCGSCFVRFVDGLQGTGAPVRNMVTYRVNSLGPGTTDGDLRICKSACPAESEGPCGRQLPGDCNQDGRFDISDPVCVLGALFLGEPELFPCGSGISDDPANLFLLSANGDAALDVSDAVYLLERLFVGGPPHAQGSDCIAILGCPDSALCP